MKGGKDPINTKPELIKEPIAEKSIENPINKPLVTETNSDKVVKPPTEQQNTVITHVVNTFKNSEDISEALQRLATEIPVGLLLNFFDKFLAIIEGVLAKIQDQLGIDMDFKNPEDAMAEIEKNLPKIKFRLLLTGVILKEMVQDPELQKVWSEFIEVFQDKYFQPFLIATLATLKEYEPQIEEQGERVEKIVSKVINRTGDAASDAFGNVVADVLGNSINRACRIDGITFICALDGLRLHDAYQQFLQRKIYQCILGYRIAHALADELVDGAYAASGQLGEQDHPLDIVVP